MVAVFADRLLVSDLVENPRRLIRVIRYIPYIFLLSIAAAWTADAQVRIGGTVADEQTGSPLSGAHVFTEDMAQGAITNAEGRFVLELPALPRLSSSSISGMLPACSRYLRKPRNRWSSG